MTILLCSFARYYFFSQRFGCCSDGETPADGPDEEGCDEKQDCKTGLFGCCPDGSTFAQGPKKQGCFECPKEVLFDTFSGFYMFSYTTTNKSAEMILLPVYVSKILPLS